MPDDHNLPYGVLGATGQQGGAVVDALLDAGAPVRAVVRRPDSDAAKALAARGVEVVTGDQDQPESMVEPLTGLAALFLMSTFTDGGPEAESRRGIAVVDAAVRAGVPRVVYSSVGGAERHTGIPHFDSKRRIEQHLIDRLPTVFVRPAFFMENFGPQIDNADPDQELVMRLAMPGDVPLQMVAVRDIGVVSAAALRDPTVLGGDALEIAGDELTGDQIAATIAESLGRSARYEAVPVDSLGDDDLQAMFRWFVDTDAYAADFDRTRQIDPRVLDLAGWLRQR